MTGLASTLVSHPALKSTAAAKAPSTRPERDQGSQRPDDNKFEKKIDAKRDDNHVKKAQNKPSEQNQKIEKTDDVKQSSQPVVEQAVEAKSPSEFAGQLHEQVTETTAIIPDLVQSILTNAQNGDAQELVGGEAANQLLVGIKEQLSAQATPILPATEKNQNLVPLLPKNIAALADKPAADVAATIANKHLASSVLTQVNKNQSQTSGLLESNIAQLNASSQLNKNNIDLNKGVKNSDTLTNLINAAKADAKTEQSLQHEALLQNNAKSGDTSSLQSLVSAENNGAKKAPTLSNLLANSQNDFTPAAQLVATDANIAKINELNQPQNNAIAQKISSAYGPNPTEQLSVHIAKAVSSNESKIDIKLTPASLGRVQIQLEIAQDGKANLLVIAEKSDTMEMLRNDSKALERALQNAGVSADAGNMNFATKEQNDQQQLNKNAKLDEDLNELLNGDFTNSGQDNQLYDSNDALNIVV